jgi:predicted DNA-binding transcriptional regulator AlpA
VGRSEDLSELVAWLQAAPLGTTIPAAALAEQLAALALPAPAPAAEPLPMTWRERLWLVPAETRLGVRQVAEAIGRPVSWVYRRTAEKSTKAPLPHRRLDGELVFVAAEVRAWIAGHEAVITPALRRA